ERQLEVAHESLFRYWPQFQAWINNDKARSRLKDVRQITRDAWQWEQHGHSPDYLILKGVPLENARRYSDENWLDAASRRYCVACEEAVLTQQELERTNKQRRIAAEEETRRVRQAAEAAAINARMEAEHRRDLRNLGLLWLGVLVVVLAAAGLFYNNELDKRRVANLVALASMIALINDPLEAVDLAYTIEENSQGNFIAPLAHALDRLTGSKVVATRDAGADFSPSGRALTQLVRDGSKLTVRIVPIDPDGSPWPAPAIIDIVEGGDNDGSLAALDVGPPIAASTNTRLVIMSFIDTPIAGNVSATFRKLVAYTITRGGDAAYAKKWPVDFPFPPSTTRTSEVSFEASGAGAAVASVQSLGSNAKPQGKVILVGNQPPTGKASQNVNGLIQHNDNREVISALAYAENSASANAGGATLITGRLDGSVFCGETSDTRIEGPDRSPVKQLRAAGTGPSWYVALHDSNKLVVGKCGASGAIPQVLDPDLVTPQSLIFRAVANSAIVSTADAARDSASRSLQLSFTTSGALCLITWPSSKWPHPETNRECPPTERRINQAVPVFAVSGKGVGDFLTLPDRSRPWVVTLNGGLRSGAREVKTVGGMPVGLPPDVSNRQSDQKSLSGGRRAASPNAAHRARIAVEKNAVRVERLVTEDRGEVVAAGGSRPIAITLNDHGVLAVLEAGGNLALVQPGKAQAIRTVLGFDGTCLKLTPDGRRTLVAGRGGEATLVDLEAVARGVGAPSPEAKKMQPLGLGAPLTACAVGNDGATVSGFEDGKVIYVSPDGNPSELS
ncbi:MAG: hypothetical protein ACK4NZ_10475, partial [Tsuneonella sp.]